MIDVKTKTMKRQFSSNKYLLFAIILVTLLALGFYGYNAFRTSRAASSQPGIVSITQSALEEDYGLRVQLVAVTAAGGLVDLRLQIVDAEKAEAFLSDSANIPALRVGDGAILRTSEDAAEQDIQFEDGKSIFMLFPNTGNVLKPSDPVNIIFGNLQLETIQSK